MTQEIQIVCKLNEVRSPFLSAFLKLHLDNVEISSSGVLPMRKHVYDPVAKKIATEWGFEYKQAQVKKTGIDAATRIYIPVDTFVQAELEKNLKSEQILNLDLAENTSDLFTPLDPIHHSEREMKYELAKLLGFGVKQLRRLKSFKFPENIEAIIPRNPSSALGIFAELVEIRIQKNVIVVDASLKASNQKLIHVPEGVIKVPLDPPSADAVYTSIFEFPEPEKLLCSTQWRDWLIQLTQIGKVVIITPPLEDEYGNKVHDSHLAAIWAEVKNIT